MSYSQRSFRRRHNWKIVRPLPEGQSIPVVGLEEGYFYEAHGAPLNWRAEVGGQLRPAMLRFVDYVNALATDQPAIEPSETDVLTIAQFLHYFIHASGWRDKGDGTLARLRDQAGRLRTLDQVMTFIAACVPLGIDPL